jgi:hypothetical protein
MDSLPPSEFDSIAQHTTDGEDFILSPNYRDKWPLAGNRAAKIEIAANESETPPRGRSLTHSRIISWMEKEGGKKYKLGDERIIY